jgi:hypothetical protein
MATVSKSKKSNQSTLLQNQLDDNQTVIDSRNRKSSRISSIGDKKGDSNNNADSDNKANKNPDVKVTLVTPMMRTMMRKVRTTPQPLKEGALQLQMKKKSIIVLINHLKILLKLRV